MNAELYCPPTPDLDTSDRPNTNATDAANGTASSFTSDILFINDMVRLLRTSRTTIERRRREGSFPFPELPAIDSRPRWSGRLVQQMIASGTTVRIGRQRFGLIRGRS